VSVANSNKVSKLQKFWIGKKAGNKLEGKIEILSGLVLIGIGIKILIEHKIF